jgi:hypothetical protein
MYYKEYRTGIILPTIKICKANKIGYIWRRNCFLKHIIENKMGGKVVEEEGVSSYWMILREGKDTVN